MKKNILNHNDEIIGFLESENVSEEEWQKILAWYKNSQDVNVSSVSARQIRQALVLRGYSLGEIDSNINSLPEPLRTLTQIAWEYSIKFERNGPLIPQLSAALSWSNEQIDDLFLFAATL